MQQNNANVQVAEQELQTLSQELERAVADCKSAVDDAVLASAAVAGAEKAKMESEARESAALLRSRQVEISAEAKLQEFEERVSHEVDVRIANKIQTVTFSFSPC